MRAPLAIAVIAGAIMTAGSGAAAQSFGTCRISGTGAYRTEIIVQRGTPCTVELRRLGITSAQIMTRPNNGQAELRGPNPELVVTATPTYVGADRFTLRVSGPDLATGLWTFRVTVR